MERTDRSRGRAEKTNGDGHIFIRKLRTYVRTHARKLNKETIYMHMHVHTCSTHVERHICAVVDNRFNQIKIKIST